MLYTVPDSSRHQNKLPLSIHLIGVHHPQEPVVRNSRFPLYQWLYCEEGVGELSLRGRKYILSSGQLALTFPNEPHTYRALRESWYVHVLGFSGTCCSELMNQLRFSQPGIYHIEDMGTFTAHFTRIMDLGTAGSPTALSKACYDFLLDLAESARYTPSSVIAQVSETVSTLISFMEEHVSQEITLELLARQVNLSKSYMSTVFRREMHQSPMQYLTMLRIVCARRYLKENPELPIAQVARLCGYENPAYFSETFRKVMGISPTEYRVSTGTVPPTDSWAYPPGADSSSRRR